MLHPCTNYLGSYMHGLHITKPGCSKGYCFCYIGPGEVSDFMTELVSFTSVVISWSPPDAPNGDITVYELTYRLNEGSPITINFTDCLSFPLESEANTRITKIMVRAYTVIGPGPYRMTANITLSSCELALF